MIKHSLLIWLLAGNIIFGAPLTIEGLRTEHEVNPTGVSTTPRLSWQLSAKDNERGKRQTGFHLLVASTAEKLANNQGDLWDHRAKKDARRHLINWAGKPLKQGTTAHWKVKVWDEKQTESLWSSPATFTVGGKRQLRPALDSSSFKSSHKGLNKIFETHKATLGERLKKFIDGDIKALGHGLDVQRATREYLYHYDSTAALWHWVSLLHSNQNEANFYPTSPGAKNTGAGTSDAGVLIPHGIWWMSGDAKPISTNWRNMDHYMVARERADLTFRGRAWDMVIHDSNTTGPFLPPEFTDLCFLGLSTRIMRELAQPGAQPLNAIRYKDFISRIRKSFAKQYLAADGSLTLDSQTAHLLALRTSVISPEKRGPVLDSLKASLKDKKLETGYLGIPPLFPVLSFTGNLDTLFDLVTQKNASKWTQKNSIYLASGATEWMMSSLAGIDASTAGFQQIRIAPQIPSGDRLTSVKAHHQSPVGRIAVSWKKSGNTFELECRIPPSTLAIITLPTTQGQTVTESGTSIKEALGAELIKRDDASGSAQILTQSGTYRFKVQ